MIKDNIKIKIVTVLVLIFILLLFGCGKSDDMPPDPGTPPPPVHSGVYTGLYGELVFSGNGKTVTVRFSNELSDAVDITDNGGEYQYKFGWYDFGECRYDVATSFILWQEQNNEFYKFSVVNASEDAITLNYYLKDGFNNMKFRITAENN